MNDIKFIEEVRQTFTSLAMSCPFSYPLLTLPIKLDKNLKAPAATNATCIVVNPDEWIKLSRSQRLFVSLHEWLHVALLHPKRIRTRKPEIYNAAADFVVNWMITNDFPDFELPPGLLFDVRYAGKAVEEVYKDLYEAVQIGTSTNQSQFKRQNDNSLNREDVINQLLAGQHTANDVMEMPTDADESELIDSIIKAATHHKLISRNKLPYGYEEYINKLRKSTVPWTRVFARLAKQAMKKATDRNPFKPDPKYLPFDVFIPTEVLTGVPKVVLIVDTSGSMDSIEFEYALGHIEKVCKMCDKLTVITIDAKVQEVIKIKNLKKQLRENKVKFKGRGGTNMNPAFEKAVELKPDLIILYSDMLFYGYPPKPKAPVIWLSRNKSNDTIPYGSYICVENTDEK